jgi:hypothetical protein
MDCPVIPNLKLDARSKGGIERIRKIQSLSNSLAKSLGFGSMANIFVGNGAPQAAYNITQQDWELLAKSLTAVPAIARNRIKQEAALQYLDHLNDQKQSKFWKAIEQGCKIEQVQR